MNLKSLREESQHENRSESKHIALTWRRVRVVIGERHLRLEVSAVVSGVWIQDDEGTDPLHDVLIDELITD